MLITWAILTGEYPPQSGGVSAYTCQVAEALVAAGDTVHIFAPPLAAQPADPPMEQAIEPVVHQHRLPDCFGAASRKLVKKAFREMPTPRRILVQYVPHAYGKRAMNVGFAWWVRQIARQENVDVMFHEVAFPISRSQRPRHQLLGYVTHRMARWIGVNAARVFVSTVSWEKHLRSLGMTQPLYLTPIPSSFEPPTILRNRMAGPVSGLGRVRIGHFGTYGDLIEPAVRQIVINLAMEKPAWQFVLIGKGGEACLSRLRADHPQLAPRVRATGALAAEQLVDELIACDLMVQPFPDGVTTRRSSVVASLRLGVPVLTNRGLLTEPFWERSGAVALTTDNDARRLVERALELGENVQELANMGTAAKQLYSDTFELVRTIDALRATAADG